LPSQPEPLDCLFCRLAVDGDHVAREDGFVAIRDIAPLAETHLLVVPERHVQTLVVRFGEWINPCAALVTVAIVMLAWRRRRHPT